MHIFFDESGDYAFPVDRFDCYVQAAVICPDTALASAEAFVRNRCLAWNLDELHAHQLSAEQLQQVADFLSDGPIELCVQLTDTVLTTPEVIYSCRLDQAAAYERSIKNYRRSGGTDPNVEADLRAHIKKAGLSSQISDGEFVHATLLVDGTVQAIQRALYTYGADEWREDFREFRFIMDAKLPGKKSAGEKYLSSKIVDLMAGSKRHRFSWRPEWSEAPAHPWVERFCFNGSVQLDPLFEHGLQFVPSHDQAGLQLADAVAFIVRKAVMDQTEDIIRCYELLSRRLADRKGHCFVVARLPAGTRDQQPLLRYQPLAKAGDRDELGGPER